MGWALVALAYLAGTLPFGLLVGRLRGIDVRRYGSGNIGATNVGRALGTPWGVLVLVLDALKGFLPVLAARLLLDDHAWVAGCMTAAVAGHVFPVFLRFRGGKGVSTALGVTLAAQPLAALCGLAVYGVVLAIRRVSALGSLAGVMTTLLLLWLGATPRAIVIAFAAICALIVARHDDNLRRLFAVRRDGEG